MTDQSANTSKRSDAIARAWATRKANAAIESTWWKRPVCLCGCGEALVRHRNPERQRMFKPGHDARLKSIAAAVLAGDLPREAVPDPAKIVQKLGLLFSF